MTARTFYITMGMILLAIFFTACMVENNSAVATEPVTQVDSRNHSTENKDKYLMALEAYAILSNDKYALWYRNVREHDHSAARTIKAAAKEYCEYGYGGRLQDDFSCKVRR